MEAGFVNYDNISLEEFKETIEYYQQSLYGQHLKAMLKEK